MRLFRANPSYELVLFDRLSPDLRESCAELAREPGFYGLLLPRPGASLRVRGVDRDTALLFLTLREPGPLPRYVAALAAAEGGAEIERLVADAVLEVHDAAAISRREGGGYLADLSRAALRYAQALGAADTTTLAARLYGFNRLPLLPRWQKRLPGPAAVEEFLGIGEEGALRPHLERGWIRLPPADGWLLWQARSPRQPAAGLRYKLYVSPRPEALPESFGDLLAGLGEVRAERFKVGADAAGMLRPDKAVAYFASFDQLGEAALRLGDRLGSPPVQGVPFSAEIAGGGLLSWGIDPPHLEGAGGSRSWRAWLVRELAAALAAELAAVAAPTESGDGGREPWELAEEHLRHRGVDTETWSPAAGWREA